MLNLACTDHHWARMPHTWIMSFSSNKRRDTRSRGGVISRVMKTRKLSLRFFTTENDRGL